MNEFSNWLAEVRRLKGAPLTPSPAPMDTLNPWIDAYWEGLTPAEALNKVDPQPEQGN